MLEVSQIASEFPNRDRNLKTRPLVDGKPKGNFCQNPDGTSSHLSTCNTQIALLFMAYHGCLSACKHFFRQMVDNAKAWAESKGLVRKNEVHGVEEYRVALQSNFAFGAKETMRTKASGRTVIQAWPSLLAMSLSGKQNSASHHLSHREGGRGILLDKDAQITREGTMLNYGGNPYPPKKGIGDVIYRPGI